MQAIMNYFFPPKPSPEPEDKTIYITSGNTMTRIRFSELSKMDKGELRTWGHKIAICQAESSTPEECQLAQVFLDEMERLLVEMS